MEEMQNSEKLCLNCRYYSQHYSKQGIKYRTVFCGHCTNSNNKNRKKNKPLEVCDFWEDIIIKKEMRKKTIKEALEYISKLLDEIAVILKDEND